jgi:hypothetical protein
VRVLLDIEWGETPFAYGENHGGWPGPLMRPEPYPEAGMHGGDAESSYGPPAEVADDLLDRYAAAEKAFLGIQREMTEAARKAGLLE